MNVTELARRLRVNSKTLLQTLPEFGFDIGARAIKVDDKIAQQIQRAWPKIKRELDRRKAEEEKERRLKDIAARREEVGTVELSDVFTVREFAAALNLPVTTLMQELMKNGILVAMNERIDFDTAQIIAEDLGYEVIKKNEGEAVVETTSEESELKEMLDADAKNATPRPAVIVVMGHVDHGKTRLLDAIRSTNVIDTEAGGITQHIGAYQIEKQGKKVTFIDTPGHEAFTVMRSRGARVADIAILVVAADDGVKPQTKEAIKIIHAAKLPYVVALNKMDKAEANPDKVKKELSEHNVLVEEWGGDVPIVEISAKEGTNIDKILDVILLVADVNADKITANADRGAIGTVIESRVDKGQGPVATVLVQAGTLKKKDPLNVNGRNYGRVRALKNYVGEDLKEALPGTPVRILGFQSAPEVGDILDVDAKDAVKLKKTKTLKSQAVASVLTQTTEDEDEEGKGKKILPIVVKADTLGSLEAVLNSLEKIQHDEVGIKIASQGLGNITDAEILKAEGTNTRFYAFNVVPTGTAAHVAREKKLPIYETAIIYDLLSNVTAELEKLLEPEIIETQHGNATVLEIFRQDKKGQIIGCRLNEGKFRPEISIRIKRAGELMGEGKITMLKSGKSETKEVPGGSEFGMNLKSRTTVLVDDVLEGYTVERKEKKLNL